MCVAVAGRFQPVMIGRTSMFGTAETVLTDHACNNQAEEGIREERGFRIGIGRHNVV